MGRMQACGHTSEQVPHWMHLSICHSGTVTAMPRFFELGGAGGNHARRIKGAHGQAVAFLRQDGLNEVLEVLGALDLHGLGAGGGIGPPPEAP